MIVLLVCLLALLAATNLRAQEPPLDSLRRAALEASNVGAAPQHALYSGGIAAGYRVREWIRQSLTTDSSIADLDRVDLIYLHALAETDGNRNDALLAAAIGTLMTTTVPLPIGLGIPLAIESDEDQLRHANRLPRRLFVDLPDGDDREKLQHFFFSAWLTSAIHTPQGAEAIGDMVEVGEELIIPGGADDPRDRRTNRLGQIFALLLEDDPDVLPSSVFRGFNRGIVGDS